MHVLRSPLVGGPLDPSGGRELTVAEQNILLYPYVNVGHASTRSSLHATISDHGRSHFPL